MTVDCPALDAESLSIEYPMGDSTVKVVSELTLRVGPGEMVCIAGRSGSGKTSILRSLAGLAIPTSGRVLWDGVDLRDMTEAARAEFRRTRAAYVDQEAGLVDALSCLENASLAAIPEGRAQARAATERAKSVLADLGLGGQLRSRPESLSGGERQRTALARALTAGTPTIIADEPTASLDRYWADRVITIIRDHANGGGSAIVASHDPGVADAADRVIEIERQ